jgi:hypothetical protein
MHPALLRPLPALRTLANSLVIMRCTDPFPLDDAPAGRMGAMPRRRRRYALAEFHSVSGELLLSSRGGPVCV